ncbi:MAG TPA: enterotoxin, partial [Candidatus Binatia bacterium]|nr:enterotoxin [Candidatus Binatia bacterium]
NGTQLQEMYITPSLLSTENWDTLAEAAAWSRANADVLVDTHWIGGDPALLEVYGWASWSPKKAILVLRNPSDKAQDVAIDIERAFELPAKTPRAYTLHSPWKEDREQPGVSVVGGLPHMFSLKPFEVLALEGAPTK